MALHKPKSMPIIPVKKMQAQANNKPPTIKPSSPGTPLAPSSPGTPCSLPAKPHGPSEEDCAEWFATLPRTMSQSMMKAMRAQLSATEGEQARLQAELASARENLEFAKNRGQPCQPLEQEVARLLKRLAETGLKSHKTQKGIELGERVLSEQFDPDSPMTPISTRDP